MLVLRLLSPVQWTCSRVLHHSQLPVASAARLLPLVISALHVLPCIVASACNAWRSAATASQQHTRSPRLSSLASISRHSTSNDIGFPKHPACRRPISKRRLLTTNALSLEYNQYHNSPISRSPVSSALIIDLPPLHLAVSTYVLLSLGGGWLWKSIKRNYRRNKTQRRMLNSAAASEFSVVTFNIRAIMDRWDERAPFLKQCIKQLDADVIAFQEVLTGEFAQDRHLVGSGYTIFECRSAWESLRQQGGAAWLVAVTMKALLDFMPTRSLMVHVPPMLQGWRERKGISNSLVRSLRDVAIAPFYGNSVATRIPGGPSHPPQILTLGSLRAAQRVCLQLPDSFQDEAPLKVWLVNTHLDHSEPATRATQAAAICEWMEGALVGGFAGVVLTGDLNAPPDEQLHRVLYERGYASAHFTANGHEPDVTWPSGIVAPLMDEGPPHCADYIYIRAAPGYTCEVTAAQVVGDRPHPDDPTLYPSDHVALRVRLRVGTSTNAAAVVCA